MAHGWGPAGGRHRAQIAGRTGPCRRPTALWTGIIGPPRQAIHAPHSFILALGCVDALGWVSGQACAKTAPGCGDGLPGPPDEATSGLGRARHRLAHALVPMWGGTRSAAGPVAAPRSISRPGILHGACCGGVGHLCPAAISSHLDAWARTAQGLLQQHSAWVPCSLMPAAVHGRHPVPNRRA